MLFYLGICICHELMVMRVIAKAIALFFETNTSYFARKIDYFNNFLLKVCVYGFFFVSLREIV